MLNNISNFETNNMIVPFNNFTDYFKALSEAFGSEDYGAPYPAYYKFCDENRDADVLIIKHLLTDENAQKSLNTFIETCLNGNRYACEFPLDDMIQLFLEKGAKPNMDRLFNPISDNLDDEIPEYGVRGRLIDAITGTKYKCSYYTEAVLVPFSCTNFIDVSMYADWKSIKAAEWQGDVDVDFESTRLSQLKDCSAYLRHV